MINDTQQLCTDPDPDLIWFFSKTIFFVTTLNTLKYWYNVVLFHCFLLSLYSVYWIMIRKIEFVSSSDWFGIWIHWIRNILTFWIRIHNKMRINGSGSKAKYQPKTTINLFLLKPKSELLKNERLTKIALSS